MLQAADDAVVVEAGHVVERGFDARMDVLDIGVAGLVRERGIVKRVEQIDDQGGDVRIAGQRLLHIVLAEGEARLAQELRHGAQDRDVAPGQPRAG